ncbi:MAG: MoxR family ATPase [Myxococcota bacterium]
MTVPFRLYDGVSELDPTIRAAWLANIPPWRRTGPPWAERTDRCKRGPPAMRPEQLARAETWVVPTELVCERVNMALHLRRPLLVSGDPGLGKTSLGWSIARCLGLGPPLRWEVNSRTTLEDGLHSYDAVGHLQDTKAGGGKSLAAFITLGPLGTALLPTELPRVLIVDELDKSSYDLPNDLLHVFEEGQFTVPALVREAGPASVSPWDPAGDRVDVTDGVARTVHHPVVVITTNRDREFPDAFMRRCVTLPLDRPDPTKMAAILAGWLKAGAGTPAEIDAFVAQYPTDMTDVLLQALFLTRSAGGDPTKIVPALRRGGGTPG